MLRLRVVWMRTTYIVTVSQYELLQEQLFGMYTNCLVLQLFESSSQLQGSSKLVHWVRVECWHSFLSGLWFSWRWPNRCWKYSVALEPTLVLSWNHTFAMSLESFTCLLAGWSCFCRPGSEGLRGMLGELLMHRWVWHSERRKMKLLPAYFLVLGNWSTVGAWKEEMEVYLNQPPVDA